MIFTAIGTLIAGAATISLFGTAISVASVIAGGLALGAKLLFSYINRSKKRTYSAVQGQLQYGANVPAGAAFGPTKVAGHRIYYAKYGEGNKYNAEVFVLGNGWHGGLVPEVFFYGKRHSLIRIDAPGEPEPLPPSWALLADLFAQVGLDFNGIMANTVAANSATPSVAFGNAAEVWQVAGFDGKITVRYYDGRPGQLADTALVNNTAHLDNPWKSTSRGAGVAYMVVEREWDETLFPQGRPEFEWVISGLREYDPRYDSTYPGGSGAQRIGDASTWSPTANPAIHRLNYQLGVRGLLSGRTLVGVGKPLAALDVDSHIASANVADTVRGGKPTYACSLYVEATDDHTEILREFEDALAGYAMNRYGLSGVLAGAPQIAVVDIGAADIRTDAPREVSYRKSAFELFNVLSGQFTSKESHWRPESLKTVTVNADVTADGRKRQAGNDFLQVTDPDIAQYLLNIRYRQNRKGGSARIPVSRRVGFKAEIGTWVTFESRTWLVSGRAFDAKLRFSLTLAETGADVYDDEGIEPGPIIIPPTTPINPSLGSTVAGFGMQVGLATGGNGEEVPVLRFTWTPPKDPTITDVRFFYFVGTAFEGQTIYEDRTSDVEKGEHITSKDVRSEVYYTGRATIRTVPDRFKTFTPWVTTATTTSSANFAVRLKALQTEMRNYFRDRDGEFERRVADLNARMTDVATANAEDIHTRTIAERKVGRAQARILREERLRADADSAFASALVGVDARLDTAEGDIAGQATSILELQGEVTDIEGEIDATASVALAAQATANQGTASGLMQVVASAGPSGWTTRLSFQGKVNAGGTMRTAGLFIDVTASQSRVALNADELFVSNGSVFGKPFYYNAITGTMLVDNAFIRELEAVNIKAHSITINQITLGGITYEAFPAGEISRFASLVGGATYTTASPPPAGIGVWFTLATISTGVHDLSLFLGNMSISATAGGPGASDGDIRLISNPSGAVLASANGTPSGPGQLPGPFPLSGNGSPSGGFTVEGRVNGISLTGSVTLSVGYQVLYWRR